MVDKYGFEKLVTYTTRSPRDGEIDGIDYHFVTDEKFEEMRKKGLFCESAEYNGWKYATATEDCDDNKIAVLTPHGLRQLSRQKGLNITSFYIKVPRRDRLVKILQRGDNIEEAYRRSLSDVGQFDGIEDEIDFVFRNDGYTLSAEDMASLVHGKYTFKNNKSGISMNDMLDGVKKPSSILHRAGSFSKGEINE